MLLFSRSPWSASLCTALDSWTCRSARRQAAKDRVTSMFQAGVYVACMPIGYISVGNSPGHRRVARTAACCRSQWWLEQTPLSEEKYATHEVPVHSSAQGPKRELGLGERHLSNECSRRKQHRECKIRRDVSVREKAHQVLLLLLDVRTKRETLQVLIAT